MDTELTPERLAKVIKYWIDEHGTNYQKRLKPLMDNEECLALARYLLSEYSELSISSIDRPHGVSGGVSDICPHENYTSPGNHMHTCLDCGYEWQDVPIG